MRIKRWIVITLENCCSVVDAMPRWTYPFVGRWLGCPQGLACWAASLDERWGCGVWRPVD